MEYDLEVITLPYDSLNIEDIVVSNFTILARSGNTIYKSTDDGENWKIAFESELKVNQLYSKDPHTILLVGEKGMVYRTMDYGETWLDERVDTDSTLIKVAARNYQDYVALAETRWLYHKFSPDKEWLVVDNRSEVSIYYITEYEDSYYYSGGFVEYQERWKDIVSLIFYQPRYKYTVGKNTAGGIITSKRINDLDYPLEYNPQRFKTDSLNLFFSNNIEYLTVKYGENSVISSYNVIALDVVPYLTIKNKVIGIFNINDTVYAIGRSGEIVVAKESEFGVSYKTKIDSKQLGFIVNSVVRPFNKTLYLASNNSRIYKMSIYEPVSSIQVETNNLIKQYNELLWIDDEVENIRVFNYLGQNQLLNYQSENRIILKKGIYFISYFYKNNYLTSKILVN